MLYKWLLGPQKRRAKELRFQVVTRVTGVGDPGMDGSEARWCNFTVSVASWPVAGTQDGGVAPLVAVL